MKREKLTVVVTRAASQSAGFVAALEQAGVAVIELPAIGVERLPLGAELRAGLTGLAGGGFDWLLLTSANSARLLAEHLAEAGLSLGSSAATLKIAAQGTPTAEACKEALGRAAEFVPRSAISEDFAAELLPLLSPASRVFFPHAERTRGAVQATLEGKVAQLASHAIYRSVAVGALPAGLRADLEAKSGLVFSFFSPSAAQAACALLGQEFLARHTLASIGPITSAALRELGFAVQIESPEHTASALASAIVGWQATR